MTRRSATASFAPGVYVFPGGKVDAADSGLYISPLRELLPTGWLEGLLGADGAPSNKEPNKQSNEISASIAYAAACVAAVRECFEELGIALVRHKRHKQHVQDTRNELQKSAESAHETGQLLTSAEVAALDRTGDFFAQCAAHGYELALDTLQYFVHWVTDRNMPRRFDVYFLTAPMPPEQLAVADEAEQFEPVWVQPSAALARHKAGGFDIIYPTVRTLERMVGYTGSAELLGALAQQRTHGALPKPVFHSCPRSGWLKGKQVIFMEHEAPFGELELTSPDGQLHHRLDWQHNAPVPLLKNLQRLTCANPHMMTGPGTNTYLVGTLETGYAVVDPGPWTDCASDHRHMAVLLDILSQTSTEGSGFKGLQAIICTHSHADHSPAAAVLQHRYEALHGVRVPIYGLPSATTARANSHFVPDVAWADEACITLGADTAAPTTLQAVHTPGHAANHVCVWLQEDGVLLSGDHILNGSTTIVDPPDGNMNDYLASLDKLAALAGVEGAGFRFIAPAHGYVLGEAPKVIAALKAHRLKREAKVQYAMRALPQGSLDDWVQLAYDDTAPALWPIAKRSLLAHVERLRSLA